MPKGSLLGTNGRRGVRNSPDAADWSESSSRIDATRVGGRIYAPAAKRRKNAAHGVSRGCRNANAPSSVGAKEMLTTPIQCGARAPAREGSTTNASSKEATAREPTTVSDQL